MSAASDLTDRPWRSVPGPADRESFFAAQARNRRATWRLTGLCRLGVALMGIPMSAVITPLVFAALFLSADMAHLLWPTAAIWSGPEGVDRTPLLAHWPPWAVGIILATLLIVPGALVVALAWMGARTLFRRAGPEALVRSLGGRPPRSGDFEEQQLGNVVAEIAIAAGVKPPAVMLLDGAVANAAVVGSSHDDAVVLVSRRLVDELDRDETQAVVAHLVGAIGNGDLRVALSMLALFRTIALLLTTLGATLGPASRRTLVRLVRLAGRRGTGGEAEDLARVDELLAASSDLGAEDAGRPPGPQKTGVLDILRAPLMMAHFAIWMCRLAFMSFVVAPLLALLWRRRRYLADATAVQLTRNPDAVARALASLSAKGGAIPGAGWAAPLFIIGPRSGQAGPLGPGAARSAMLGDDLGVLSFDPPMATRMARLRRQGATIDLALTPYRFSPVAIACITLLVVVVGALLMGCALMITYVALALDIMLLVPMMVVAHFVLRLLFGWL